MSTATLAVSAIQNGSVIDHIPHGSALRLVKLLGLAHYAQKITLGLNLPSKSMGSKDLLKIEGRLLTEAEIHEIAVFAANASINLIEDYKVQHKFTAILPQAIKGLLVCPNNNCVSRMPEVSSYFHVKTPRQEVNLICHYCEGVYKKEDIVEYTR